MCRWNEGIAVVQEVRVDRELDLTGEVCPYAFVKSKLMLETMAVGEILRVIVDDSPETDSMPLSLEIEGHDVLSVGAAGSGLREIIVRRQDWNEPRA